MTEVDACGRRLSFFCTQPRQCEYQAGVGTILNDFDSTRHAGDSLQVTEEERSAIGTYLFRSLCFVISFIRHTACFTRSRLCPTNDHLHSYSGTYAGHTQAAYK
ncbi:hypothetical protein I7I50_01049 [Histoplasma capsulatum G186AR]|uniref:Uncharacterized protein n=1 Tax=Ajellomyces capsulatus TaxID=5037 RepID=A0A8H7YGL0_AJECA|nr:hypothetical protein I7I52_08315 [Histoplasma capsulatum]QSS73025.1 hypothetical protein I7I50_01049 [Histoplasma capsulatum G186AR]